MKIGKIILTLLCLTSFISCSNNDQDSTNFNNDELKFERVRRYQGYRDLPSVGNSKMLVIPVVFSDCYLTSDQLDEEYTNINNVFKGGEGDTYWESVRSFYQKSSYNKLNLDVTVSPYFYVDYSIVEANKAFVEGIEPTYNILEDACLWYAENFDDYNSFDSNNDGIIDSIWLIYMDDYNTIYFANHPTRENETNLKEFLWAYTYWYTSRWEYKDLNRPFNYSWGSYKFMHEGDINGTDAHTFIHETGHLLGLTDYYNYDYSPLLGRDRTKPCGALDMMDNNIYDHNAYSKYLLNWIDPLEVSDGTYTLESFQKNGDALIIRTSDNNSPMEEYLIIEYFTPDGLNELDASTPYNSRLEQRFTESGFKIYHVDSRLGLFSFDHSGIEFNSYYEDYTNFSSDARSSYIQIANSNTPSRSAIKNNKLISLISSLGNSRLYFKGALDVTAEDKDLFQSGDKLESFKFNSYDDNDLVIEILSSDENQGTIKFSGIGK